MLSPDARQALEDTRRRAEADPSVVGLVLSGSAAREGMATEHSDVDVYVVLEPSQVNDWSTRRSALIDEIICTTEEIAVPGPFGTDGWWSRYSFAHVKVLLDRLDGGINAMVHAQATLTPQEAADVIRQRLDGYVNFAYRSLKSVRDGRHFEARHDAAESLPWALDVLFAFSGRIRPYNKYLPWELEHFPLAVPEWAPDVLLPLLDAVLTGDAAAQRELFRVMEREARAYGGRNVSDFCARTIEAWGDELALLRHLTP